MTLKKKESPEPLVRAVDTGAPVRPLSPARRLVLPLGIAAGLILAAGTTAAFASGALASGARASDTSDTLRRVGDFISPNIEPPRMAGEMVAPPPTQQQGATPVPPTTPTQAPVAKPRPPIIPTHEVPKTAGIMPPPHNFSPTNVGGQTI
jgi:hypothetical protein